MIQLYQGIYDQNSILDILKKECDKKYITLYAEIRECHYMPAAAPAMVRIEIDENLRKQIQSLRKEYNKNNKKNRLSTSEYLQLIFDLANLWSDEHQHNLRK